MPSECSGRTEATGSISRLSGLFGETFRLIEAEQTLTVVEGILGSYPNTFIDVTEVQLAEFVEQLSVMKSESDYQRLLDRFAIRRTDPRFWPFSDWMQNYYRQSQPLRAGLLDYNRLENR